MKRLLILVPIALLAAWILTAGLTQKSVRSPLEPLAPVGDLPVLDGGRVKPLDSLARNTLLLMRGKSNALDLEGRRVPALEWYLNAVLNPAEAAAAYRVFRVDHPDLLALLDKPQDKPVYFTYAELERFFSEIERQARRIDPEAPEKTPFQKALLNLRMRLIHYQGATESFRPPEMPGPVADRYLAFRQAIADGWAMRDPHKAREGAEKEAFMTFLDTSAQIQGMGRRGSLLLIPPAGPEGSWSTVGDALVSSVKAGTVDAVALGYARLADALSAKDAAAMRNAAEQLAEAVAARHDTHPTRVWWERVFNHFDPQYVAMQLYVLAGVLSLMGLLAGGTLLRPVSMALVAVGFLVHTGGLGMRVYLTGYAPVTNLYSSAVFVGWGSVLFGLMLERGFRNGLGNLVSAVIGFCSLLVAHHLAAASGSDTMEMMRAVLDSNFWLSTHVITITIGYSAVFLAGFLGIVFVLWGVLGAGMTARTAESIDRMVYGITAAALFFSFIGTVLGGIWADQSWGRFWGWDPKENGALLIVIWTALILHAKRIRMFSRRGIMVLAIAGNIVTSWSWFGVNMLGVGLHSYGFMDEAFKWLILFWSSQAAIMLVALLPRGVWRSGRELGDSIG